MKTLSVLLLCLLMMLCNIKAQSPNLQWAKQFEGASPALSQAITVDANGNVYTTGWFQGTIDCDPGPGVFNLDADISKIYVSKLDASGNFVWAKQMGGSSGVPYGIAVDLSGNVYTTGEFSWTCDFDPGSGVYNLVASGNTDIADIFVSKLDASGNFVWAKQMGGGNLDRSYSIALDASGNVYTTGFFQGTADFDPGIGTYNLTSNSSYNFSAFISKLDASGNFVWAKQFDGPNSTIDSKSITVDANGNVYTTGFFSSRYPPGVDFDPGAGTYYLDPGPGAYGSFVSKLDASGNFVWAKMITNGVAVSIAIDANANVYITGVFSGTVDFDPGPEIYNLTSTADGNGYVLKLNSLGNFIWAKCNLAGNGENSLPSIVVDANENVYTSGAFAGTVDFDPGAGTYNLNASDGDIFLSKLDIFGNLLWAVQFGRAWFTGQSYLAIDNFGQLYITGTFPSTADFDPGPGIYNMTAVGGDDIFVVKLKQEQSVFTTPGITLSKSIVPAGQTMTIQGNRFTPNGTVTLNFYGAGGLYGNNITANAQGSFSFTYNIPSNAQDGIASVKAYDTLSHTYSIQQNFQLQLTPANTPVNSLTIISPQQSNTYSTGQQIHFIWSDKLQRQYGSYYYPLAANTGKRLYRYKVEYQIGTSGAWILVNTFTGTGAVNSTLNLNQVIQINTTDNNCRIRVIDDYAPANLKTTVAFSVFPVTSNLKAELIWDKSFPEPNPSPLGVAADGVARLYFKVSKLNPNTGSDINSVSVSITDGSHNTTSWLGKVKKATILDAYSTEANDANTISGTSNTFINGGYWFWYVAPEDFTESEADPYANLPERFVTLHVTAQLANGSTDTKDIAVKIVRPPLMMVHGLASSETGWNKFHYNLNNIDYAFRTSPLFIHAKAINLNPSTSFLNNGSTILSPNDNGGSNKLNTFQGNIDAIRNKGFAANQVDYVCHSMGGCVLRTAINIWKDRYYGKGEYQNYGKGYVHKAITINTPHNSSPVADAVTEFIPKAPRSINIALGLDYKWFPNTPFVFDFIEPNITNDPFNFPWNATPAIKNLQVSDIAGGINFPTTAVKNHMIAGDIDLYNKETASFLAELDKYMDLIDRCLKIMRDISPTPVLNNILKYGSKTVRALSFIEYYSEQKGFPNFLGDGDLIVPLSSQLAGLPQSNPNLTIFHNTSLLNANHSSITDRTDVGNRVKQLLNTPLSSSSFADVIPSTPQSSSNRAFRAADAPTKILTSIYDTTKVKILAPFSNSILYADSSTAIQFELKDTSGLAYIDIDFQGVTTTSSSRNPIQIVSTQVNPAYIGDQLISVTAVYDRDTATEFHTDTLAINVQTNAQLLDFQVEPEAKEMQRNEVFYPNYKAVYNTSIAGLPNNTPGIIVLVADTALIKYDPDNSSFTAIADTGTTFITFNYKTFTDTVFISLNNYNNYKVLCPQNNISFFAGVNDVTKTYKWQVDTSTGFIDLTDSIFYSNTNTTTLILNSPPTSIYGYRYRCIFYDSISSVITMPQTIKFQTIWTGTYNTAWANVSNWSCGLLPDENTDVILNSGVPFYPIVNSNVSIRSLTTAPSASVSIANGFKLTITGKPQ